MYVPAPAFVVGNAITKYHYYQVMRFGLRGGRGANEFSIVFRTIRQNPIVPKPAASSAVGRDRESVSRAPFDQRRQSNLTSRPVRDSRKRFIPKTRPTRSDIPEQLGSYIPSSTTTTRTTSSSFRLPIGFRTSFSTASPCTPCTTLIKNRRRPSDRRKRLGPEIAGRREGMKADWSRRDRDTYQD